jgi:hypothetical protein
MHFYVGKILSMQILFVVQQLYISGDTELVVNQVMGESNYHDSHMTAYRQEVRSLEKIDGFEVHHILR